MLLVRVLMNNRSYFFILSLLVLAIIQTSCVTKKNAIYFQSPEVQEVIQNNTSYEATIQSGDILSIEVSAIDPEIAKPFNQAELVRQGTNQTTTYTNGVPASIGYLVTVDSMVNLPIVGNVKIAGLTITEAIDTLVTTFSAYLDSPTVTVQILNYKVTVLGDVEHPGTFSIPNGRITLLEAIGIAGDLKLTGKRTNVLVIRNEADSTAQYRVDLTTQELFSSPVYYLKQNDVVYIEPNAKSRFDGGVAKSAGGIVVATASLMVSLLILITN